MIEFNQTELGKKIIKTMPKLMNDYMMAGQQWGERTMPTLIEALERRLKEEGIDPPKFQ